MTVIKNAGLQISNDRFGINDGKTGEQRAKQENKKGFGIPNRDTSLNE